MAAALDWIEAAGMEFGTAPYSPPGWPLKVGDRVDDIHPAYPQISTTGHPTAHELADRFGHFYGKPAVNWIDGWAFGAAWDFDGAGSRTYEGHFPMKIDREAYEVGRLPAEVAPRSGPGPGAGQQRLTVGGTGGSGLARRVAGALARTV